MYFKRNNQVYLHSAGVLYKLPIYSDINFSQTLKQQEFEVVTLHSMDDLYTESAVQEANPGNCNFTIPILDSMGQLIKAIIRRPYSIDLYVENEGTIVKLASFVPTSIVFNTVKDELITLSVSGQFSKASPSTLPPNPVSFSTGAGIVSALGVTLGGVNVPYINSINVELSNSVIWDELKTMHSGEIQYPETFYLTSRVFSGTIESTSNVFSSLNSYANSSTMVIEMRFNSSEVLYFSFASVVYTERLNVEPEILKKAIDFRLNVNTEPTVRIKGENI